jgi:pyroglutamyl-peptidase
MGTPVMSEGPLVVTGFEPFGGRWWNRSWEAVRWLAPRPGLETLQLPVHYARLREIIPAIASRAPRCVLLLGESPAWTLRVEQVAVNTVNPNHADNSGAKPLSDTVIEGGPQTLQASWDARAVARKLTDSGIAATASFHAGTYACNAALYLTLRALRDRAAVGFLHVPCWRWPFGTRLGRIRRAVDVCLEALRHAQPGVAAHDPGVPTSLR